MVYKLPKEAIGDDQIDSDKLSSNLIASWVPINGIIMWSGTIAQAEALTNWAICDGSNGTPDLRDKFVMGVGSTANPSTAAVDDEGGEATKTLGTANLPSHTHTNGTLATDDDTHNHRVRVGTAGGGGGGNVSDRDSEQPGSFVTNQIEDDTHNHDVTGNTGDQGGTMGQAFENLPPYWSLCYLMRTT